MSPTSPSPELLARIEAAQAAVNAETALLQREFGRAESMWKSDGTRVTAVDVAISENIFRALAARFPQDQYFSEELAQTPQPIQVTSEFVWVLDPIDGTNNYAAGIVHCAISLALLRHGQPVYGVIYDLSRRVLIHGGPGFGVWDGDRPAAVKRDAPTSQSIIGFHSPHDKLFAPHAQVVTSAFKIRGLGSSTLHLAYVGVGIFEGTVDHNVRVWDIAAAVPLVWAGGGTVDFLNGEVFPLKSFDLKMARIFYVAGAPAVVRQLRALLQA